MGFIFAYVIQRLPGLLLPLNHVHFGTPQGARRRSTAVTPDLAFNTAVSFVTNTNWQIVWRRVNLSYFVQMTALTVQNFLSAAAGVAVSIALIRGFARKQVNNIGNFWVDVVRATVYIFLPLSLVGALFLCSQGVIQNFQGLHDRPRRWKAPRRPSRRARGFARGHQDGGNQRRRVLQCQLRPSVREPHSADQFHPDLHDLRHPRRPHLHVRKDGR